MFLVVSGMLSSKLLASKGLIQSSRAAFSMSAMAQGKTVAVILSGCGVYDGTEVHEAAACLAALTRHGLEPKICAPDVKQAHVVDHSTGQEMEPSRSVMVEAARIARGAVTPLSQLKADASVDAVVIPGGFGAAKNLSSFGFKGGEMEVNEEVERVLKEFQSAGKPIALCCIAPIIAAKVFGSSNVTLTLGMQGDEAKWPYGGSIEVAKSFGANMEMRRVDEVCVDKKNKIVTTPAFMYNGAFHEIQDGVSAMIDTLAKMIE